MPRNFNMYLMEENSVEAVKIFNSNWTGAVYKISRTGIKKYRRLPELQTGGIYFLLGTALDSGRKCIYIGQADARNNGNGICHRIGEQHDFENDDKYYWSEAIIVVKSGGYNLGATELNYLENFFYNRARSADAYILLNRSEPKRGNPSQGIQSDMEEFAKHTEFILRMIGCDAFTQARSDSGICMDDVDEYENKWGDDNIAIMRIIDGDFVVLKDSNIEPNIQASIPNSARAKRDENADAITDGKLTRDVAFNSPSQALAFVRGMSISGPQCWIRINDGRTLREVNDEQ